MTEIFFCSVPFLDMSYDNVLSFKNEQTRQKYFRETRYQTKEKLNIKYDGSRATLTVPKNTKQLLHCDYLTFTDEHGKDFFYFISDKTVINDNNTLLSLSLDIWTTYLFDYDFLNSFVERSHVNRWNNNLPTQNNEDEGLAIGEYIQTSQHETICEMNNSVIVCSSVPIGKVYRQNSSGGSIEGGSTRGQISPKGFRFIKGYEGFSPYGAYLSGESFRTVGYGSTEKFNIDFYNKHKPFPCSEQLASEIYLERITNEFGSKVWKALQDVGIELQIKPNQFDAMCSLSYNRGINGFLNDSTSPWKLIKENPNNPKIKDIWENYAITSNGNVLNGLILRRKAEVDIYINNEYEMKSIGKFNENGNIVGTVTDNNGNGYIPPSLTDNGDNATDLQLKILSSAKSLIGKPYIWGGNYPPLGTSSGTDCSGLCQWAYNDNGKGDLIGGRWTTETIGKHGTSISKNEIQIADLILTPGHVVMYGGFRNNKHYIVEAPKPGLNIREREYTFPTNIISIRRLL